MEDRQVKVFILVLLAAVESVKASNLCTYDGRWSYHKHTTSCMTILPSNGTFNKALTSCGNFQGGAKCDTAGNLVFIFDKETNYFVKGLLKNTSSQAAFIGLNYDLANNQYSWGNTRQILGGYNDWLKDQERANKNLSAVCISDKGWSKCDAHSSNYFVCQLPAEVPLPLISCPSAEIGQASNITCTLNPEYKQVAWSELNITRSKGRVAKCMKGCSGEAGGETTVTADNTVTASLQIKNVSGLDRGAWTCSVKLSGDEKITSEPCNMVIYNVPETIDCKTIISQDALNVSCTTSEMFTNGVCRWNINQGRTLENSITYNTGTNGTMEYQMTVCHASIASPAAGDYLFKVSVNTSGLNGAQSSKTESLKVVLEPPENPPVLYYPKDVMLGPQLVVSVNQTVTITCLIKGGSPGVYSTVVECYRQQERESRGNVSSINIITTIDLHNHSCSCYGKHVTGSTNKTFVTFLVVDQDSLIFSYRNLVIIVAAATLGLLMLVIIVSVVFVLVRRRRAKRNDLNKDSIHSRKIPKDSSSTGDVQEDYENIKYGPLPKDSSSTGHVQEDYNNFTYGPLTKEVLNKDFVHSPKIPTDSSSTGHVQEDYNNFTYGPLTKGTLQTTTAQQENFEEDEYFNVQSSKAPKSDESTDPDNVYGNITPSDKMGEDKRKVNADDQQPIYDHLTSTEDDTAGDGIYSAITTNNERTISLEDVTVDDGYTVFCGTRF